MSREPNSDQIVTRWVDDGPEVAPERFVWAALDQVEHTPQRGRWRVALANAPMLLKVAVPVLGAVAVITVGIFAFGRINSAPAGTPVESPAAVVSPTTSADPCRQDVAQVSTPGTLDVMWCVPRGTDRVIVPFTMEAPESWTDQVDIRGELLYLKPPGEPAVVVALSGPDDAQEWTAEIAGNPLFHVTEPETVATDAGDATVLTVTAAPGDTANPPTPIFRSTYEALYLVAGKTARVWILDGPHGEAVAFGTTTDDREFPAWADTVGQAVQTVEWGSTTP